MRQTSPAINRTPRFALSSYDTKRKQRSAPKQRQARSAHQSWTLACLLLEVDGDLGSPL